jgi:hypothetical protein
LQTLVTLRSNRAVVNKDIRSIRAPDESVSLGVMEPLDGSFQTFRVPPSFRRPLSGGVKDEPAVIYDIFLRGRRTVKGLRGPEFAGVLFEGRGGAGHESTGNDPIFSPAWF